MNGSPPPSIRKRNYWIQFKIVVGENNQAIDGQIHVGRDIPIRGVADLNEISALIAESLRQAKQLPEGAKAIQVISWTKFEDETIILGTAH